MQKYVNRTAKVCLLFSGQFLLVTILAGAVIMVESFFGRGSMNGVFSIYFLYFSPCFLIIVCSSWRAVPTIVKAEMSHGKLGGGI